MGPVVKYLDRGKNYGLRDGKVTCLYGADVVVGDKIICLKDSNNIKFDDDDDYWFEIIAVGIIVTDVGTLMPQTQEIFKIRHAEELDYDMESVMLVKLLEFHEEMKFIEENI